MIVFADFETYWDKQFTLSKLTPPEYIMDPRFQVHGCAIQEGVSGKPRWLNAGATSKYFSELPVDLTAVVTFNALFDSAIMAWRYGYVPELMIDVLGMARAVIGSRMPGRSFSLAKVAEFLEIGEKGGEVENTCGRTTDDLVADKDAYSRLANYAINDVKLTAAAYAMLRADIPESELQLCDLVLRAAIRPQLHFDRETIRKNLVDQQQRKAQLLARCGTTIPSLMSAERFKGMLEGMGVSVPNKTSPTGKQIPALAKTDLFMQDLSEHPDPEVAALAAARLGLKSTLEETRSQRLLTIADVKNLPNASYPTGYAPVPIKYGAARTHRFGGDWRINLQNLPRGSELRKAFKAPRGCSVIVADLKQIEARMAAWFCKQQNLVTIFEQGLDPYAHLASKIFNRSIDPKVDKLERFIGKTGILGLGYGAGAPKFHTMVHMLAKSQLGKDIPFTERDAVRTVETYRETYPRIKQTWNELNDAISTTLVSGALLHSFPAIEIERGQIVLPNGLILQYPDLVRNGMGDWTYRDNNTFPKIYGAKLLENIIQSLARVALTTMALRLNRNNLRFAMQVHDELVFVVADSQVARATQVIEEEMTREIQWAIGLPLGVDIHHGKTYGDAK
jgi:DNA polymerase